jgi:hypothetical protein
MQFAGIFRISSTDRITQMKLADFLCDRFDQGEDTNNQNSFTISPNALNAVTCRVSPMVKGG